MTTGSGTGTQATGSLTPIRSFEPPQWFSAVWVWDASAGAWINNTLVSQSASGTAFTIFDDANDWTYLGSQSRYDMGVFTLSVMGNVGTLTWQYYMVGDTNDWVTFTPNRQYDFSINGVEEFPVRHLTDWGFLSFNSAAPHAAAPPDQRARYWVRVRPISVTTSPTVYRIQRRPYAAYCTATDVAKLLQLDSDFSSSTTPTRDTVEDYIAAAQSFVDFRTQKAWRPSHITQEHYDFNISGIKLMNRDILQVFSVEVWNGAEWDSKTEGRTNDWFFVPDTGMLYWSRYFLLPARLQSYNAPVWRWGWGEFNKPVRITYLYGKDVQSDHEQGMQAWDITRKKAAIDLLQAHDYGIIAVSGADKITLDRKVENWKQEIDDQLEGLRGWVVI